MTPEEKQQHWKVGFFNMDPRILAEIPDNHLAELQARVTSQTAQYLRAEHEWQRRLIMRQVRSAIWASVIGGLLGIIATITGVILGWWIAHL